MVIIFNNNLLKEKYLLNIYYLKYLRVTAKYKSTFIDFHRILKLS